MTQRAIVVDDSRTMRSILRRTLEQLGFEVLEAGSGREALAKLGSLEGEHPSVALVDWNMPEMTGLDLVRALRSDGARAGMRVMMVTTEAEMDRVQTALESGADEYLMKPFTKEALAEKLMLLGVA